MPSHLTSSSVDNEEAQEEEEQIGIPKRRQRTETPQERDLKPKKYVRMVNPFDDEEGKTAGLILYTVVSLISEIKFLLLFFLLLTIFCR